LPNNTVACGSGGFCDGSGNCKCKTKSDANLLTNPGFDGNTNGWNKSSPPLYSTNDVDNCTGSGSVVIAGIDGKITNGSPNLDQCANLKTAGRANYVFGFLFKGAPGGSDGYCAITFYTGPGCTGDSSTPDVNTAFAESDGNSWQPGGINLNTNTDTASIDVFCSGANGSGYYDRLYLSPGASPGF